MLESRAPLGAALPLHRLHDPLGEVVPLSGEYVHEFQLETSEVVPLHPVKRFAHDELARLAAARVRSTTCSWASSSASLILRMASPERPSAHSSAAARARKKCIWLQVGPVGPVCAGDNLPLGNTTETTTSGGL